MFNKIDPAQVTSFLKVLRIEKLTVEQIKHIDRMLTALDGYGEVHLIVQNGEVRYINKVESFKAWKPEPNR